MNDTEDDMEEVTAAFLESSRFWIQRVFVPILVFIGVGGNVVTVMILTRRRMRCSTHIYLTALAVADLIYLLFVLLLSFEHYPNIHERRYELYWRLYGIAHWLCDAASSTSVWLTVSFTIERYISVSYPLKGTIYCTEGRAKNIITIISLLCLLSTVSTTFEHQLTFTEQCVQEKCLETKSINETKNDTKNELVKRDVQYDIATTNYVVEDVKFSFESNFNNLQKRHVKATTAHAVNSGSRTIINPKDFYAQEDVSLIRIKKSKLSDCKEMIRAEELEAPCNGSDCSNDTCCIKSYTIDTEPTELGKNETYTSIMYWFSALTFGLVPLVLIATFNCFLVNAVYESTKARKAMMNNAESTKQRHENRITTLLIGIVVLFLLCQTPTASFLIYDALDGASSKTTKNIKLALGNIFNFLLTLNASCNFLMYCVLSANYRRTFKNVFCAKKPNGADTSAFSVTRSTSHRERNGFKRNRSEYLTPRNLESQSLTSIPRSKSLMTRPRGKARSSDLNV